MIKEVSYVEKQDEIEEFQLVNFIIRSIKASMTFRWPCIVINSYECYKTNYMH